MEKCCNSSIDCPSWKLEEEVCVPMPMKGYCMTRLGDGRGRSVVCTPSQYSEHTRCRSFSAWHPCPLIKTLSLGQNPQPNRPRFLLFLNVKPSVHFHFYSSFCSFHLHLQLLISCLSTHPLRVWLPTKNKRNSTTHTPFCRQPFRTFEIGFTRSLSPPTSSSAGE